jgi:hypothetical protein
MAAKTGTANFPGRFPVITVFSTVKEPGGKDVV